MTLEAEVRLLRKAVAELVKVEAARLDLERRSYIGMPSPDAPKPPRRDTLDPMSPPLALVET